MNEKNYITYGAEEKAIVRAGIPAIQKVLLGTNKSQKLNLLFALDWFMDPYFGQDISAIHDELVELLQTVVISANDEEVSSDALGLLTAYEWPPFEILEKNLEQLSTTLKPQVLYAIQMDTE